MDYSKSGRFFPNECYVCKSSNKLIRCKCNMISYCGEDHQSLNKPIHETFCTAIMELLKEKNIDHIHEELFNNLAGVNEQLKVKFGRSLTSLEMSMFCRPRICFVCRKFNQGDLKDCPRCPMVSFCSEHQDSKLHEDACAVMRKYLNLLNTAEELNIDLQFLPSCFPFIMKKIETICMDVLTFSVDFKFSKTDILNSQLPKINLCDFISVVSKLHIALQKVDNAPTETTIHINALSFKHSIVEENYWEFLLHLNPGIKSLKIVIIGIEYFKNLETTLCKNCHSMEKTLFIEVDSRPYEQYMLDENYKTPNILFSCAIDSRNFTEKIKIWSHYDCPIVLAVDLIETFNKTKYILEASSAFQIIYDGQIYSPFDDPFASGSGEHYIIFKSKSNSCTEGNNRTIKSKENDSGGDSYAKIQNQNFESISFSFAALSEFTTSKSHAKEIENEETNLKETESRNNNYYKAEIQKKFQNKIHSTEVIETHVVSEDDDKNEKIVDVEQDTEDVESLSSTSSFIIIPEPGNNYCNTKKDGNKNLKQHEGKTVSESSSDDNNVESVENQKLNADKNLEENLEDEAKKTGESQSITANEGQVNFSHLFLVNHISFLQSENKRQQDEIKRQQDENKRQQDENKRQEDENKRQQDDNERLRTQLTSSVEVVTKLQNKIAELQGICSNLVKKNKLIREATRDIDVDICSVLEEKMFEIQ